MSIKSTFALLGIFALLGLTCHSTNTPGTEPGHFQIHQIDLASSELLSLADKYLHQPPTPITNWVAQRSAGGLHDFYSEGDYWWPNPEDPDGPYLRKDGQTNPENFTAHRRAMRDLNQWVSTLVAAYLITNDKKYAAHALLHLKAFFLDPATLMNPHLRYGQAVKGKATGRRYGIIDTIHLIEIAKAIEKLESKNFLKGAELTGLKDWFFQYATWMNTHPYGLKERDHGNNHSTWWATQIAAFAHLSEQEELMEIARQQFKYLLSAQMAKDGSFPEELARTKPYNYSLFTLEAYSLLCKIASTPQENLWHYEGKNGSLKKAWDFMRPFIEDKSKWIKAPDVQHFDEIPIQSPGILLAAMAYQDQELLEIWKTLSPERKSQEISRNFPIRVPFLWLE